MAKPTVRILGTSGENTTGSNAAPLAQIHMLAKDVAALDLRQAKRFNLNALGGTIDYSPSQAARFCRGGGVWVDYCRYPWEQGNTLTLSEDFGTFVRAASIRMSPVPPPEVSYGVSRAADPFDFRLSYWGFSGLKPEYPYPDGLVSTTSLAAIDGHWHGPYSHTTSASRSKSGTTYDIYIYSMVGIPVGRGWYFWAYPSIDPGSFAKFIGSVLGTPSQRAASKQGTAATSPHTTAGTVVQTARHAASKVQSVPPVTLRLTSPYTHSQYVTELQRDLTALSFSTKGVDGTFGPNTRAAVLAFQKSRKGRSTPYGRVAFSGIVGPATWYALLHPSLVPAVVSGSGGAGTSSGGSGHTSSGGKGKHAARKVDKVGHWEGQGSKSKPYALVNGKRHFLVLTDAQLTALRQNGGTHNVLGTLVSFTKAPGEGAAGGFSSFIDGIAKATGLPVTDVELLGAAGALGAVFLLAGK